MHFRGLWVRFLVPGACDITEAQGYGLPDGRLSNPWVFPEGYVSVSPGYDVGPVTNVTNAWVLMLRS